MFEKYKIGQIRLKRWANIMVKIALVLLLLLLVAWGVFYYYVQVNKKPLIKKITTTVNEQFNGEVTIRDLDIVFWKEFPSISIRLKDVAVIDSMYNSHKNALLKSESIFLKLDFTSLFSQDVQLKKVIVTNGKFHVFVDAQNYSNRYLLQSQKKSNNNKHLNLRNIRLENVRLLYEYIPRQKRFDMNIANMNATIQYSPDSMIINAPVDILVHELGFKLDKGSYLKNKRVIGKWVIHYDKHNKVFEMPLQPTEIDGEDLLLGMTFRFNEKPISYIVKIKDNILHFKRGVSFLNRHIAKNFTHINTKEPISVYATIEGLMRYPDTPDVQVAWQTENNELTTSVGVIKDITFSGLFTNHLFENAGYGDPNSIIYVNKMKGEYEGLPFIADSVFVLSFKNPYLHANIHSNFNVEKINKIVGNSFILSKGTANFDVKYKGYLNATHDLKPKLFGTMRVLNTKMVYLPRSLKMDKVNLDLAFNGADMLLKKVEFMNGKSYVKMSGIVKGFINTFFGIPEPTLLDWHVKSHYIDINDFRPFAVPRNQTKYSKASNKTQKVNMQLSELMDKGNMVLHLDVKKVVLDNFLATNLKAQIMLLSDVIKINDINANLANGSVKMNATLNQNESNNPFTLKGEIEQVEVGEFMALMDNFGMATLTSKNINGHLDANIDIKGRVTDKGTLLKRSINGTTTFSLNKGEIIDFQPFINIKKYIFKRRNLEHITFNEIHNTFIINDGKVIIQPMAIESSAITIYTKGIYSFHDGTDISMEIPLRNPKQDSALIAQGKSPDKRSGIKIYLRAVDDGEDGVNIKWVPRKKDADAVDDKLLLNENGELLSYSNEDSTIVDTQATKDKKDAFETELKEANKQNKQQNENEHPSKKKKKRKWWFF